MKHIISAFLACILVAFTAPASATEIDLREHVEVVGTSELKVVPNEFVLRSNVMTFDKSLDSAAADNAGAVARLSKNLQKLGIERKYVVTDEIRVDTVTEGYRERGDYRLLGYRVSRDVMVVLHEATQVEPAMRTLFAAGVDRLSMTKGHTDMADLLMQAQTAAGHDAARKAKLLSSTMGRLLGQAVAIAEESGAMHRGAQNFVYAADTPDLGDSLSLGKIRVSAAVRVKYLLR